MGHHFHDVLGFHWDIDICFIHLCCVSYGLHYCQLMCRTRWTFGISSVALKQELARRTEPDQKFRVDPSCRPFKTTLLGTVLKDLKNSKCNLSTELVGSWDSSINHFINHLSCKLKCFPWSILVPRPPATAGSSTSCCGVSESTSYFRCHMANLCEKGASNLT
jgi:hypothetical protein